jgi:3',5'-nucleoside bisphosphate phosphatase
MLELHCHTTYSDGTLTPTELVAMARQTGVSALAITDHDTMNGWDEALAAAGDDVEIVPGLELSTSLYGRSLHILGFYPDRAKLQQPLDERLAGRHRRTALILEQLATLGYPVELPELPLGTAPGRPHIAAAMVAAGYVKSSHEAFDRFLGDYKPAYVPYEPLDAIAGVQLLRRCGAIPVWAHAQLFYGAPIEAVLPELVDAGLMGLEIYHPNHSPSDMRQLQDLCAQYDLIQTGGSDYHGPSRDYPALNSLKVPAALLQPLKALRHIAENTDLC